MLGLFLKPQLRFCALKMNQLPAQGFYFTLLSTIESNRLSKTRKHLKEMEIEFMEDLQPSERRPRPPGQSESESYGLTRWEAITYKQTDVNAICTRRHIEILRRAIAQNQFPHLIAEDDARFTSLDDFRWAVDRAMNTKYPWRLFLFGCVTHPVFMRIPLGFSNLQYVPTPLMAHAYFVSREGAKRLVSLSEEYFDLAYDKLFRYLGRCITIWPEVAYQAVNPHQLQAIIRRKSGGDWLLTMTNTFTMSFWITLLLVAMFCLAHQTNPQIQELLDSDTFSNDKSSFIY